MLKKGEKGHQLYFLENTSYLKYYIIHVPQPMNPFYLL